MDTNKGHIKDIEKYKSRIKGADSDSFVLEKSIFNNVFNKDIQRIYIYKKAERLSKALTLVTPAFRDHPSLRDRVDRVSVALIDATIGGVAFSLESLSKELLALSSILSIARSAGILSPMNADLISEEAHVLLQEAASYEMPRVSLGEAPTLAALARASVQPRYEPKARVASTSVPEPVVVQEAGHKVQIKDIKDNQQGRRDAILSVLRTKSPSYIKDISTVIRDVSEKTIQRELQALVVEGVVTRSGDRRWTQYSIS
ncbi:MAG: hypothetical protein ABA06_02335 [Parcubacteria bacterium C7867-001]|nr:MAG: hypothetical protein ABA06_02335 [Parcubacteria bacterium C7867-001]